MDEIARQFVRTLSILAPEAEENDFLVSDLYGAVGLLENSDAVSAVFPAIFELFEKCPDADFGTPGPLVHLLERDRASGYVALLFESLARKPTPHTVWMANRQLNASDITDTLRASVENALKKAASHPLADEGTRRIAAEYIEYQKL